MRAEAAIVYRGGNRRYFSKVAALHGHAKAKFRAKHPCECESMDFESRYSGYTCHVHDLWEKVKPRYLRWLKRVIGSGKIGSGCEWVYEINDGVWRSHCGARWNFDDGEPPASHDVHFCSKCGKRLVVKTGSGNQASPEHSDSTRRSAAQK
jgi:hypothetical protein